MIVPWTKICLKHKETIKVVCTIYKCKEVFYNINKTFHVDTYKNYAFKIKFFRNQYKIPMFVWLKKLSVHFLIFTFFEDFIFITKANNKFYVFFNKNDT